MKKEKKDVKYINKWEYDLYKQAENKEYWAGYEIPKRKILKVISFVSGPAWIASIASSIIAICNIINLIHHLQQ